MHFESSDVHKYVIPFRGLNPDIKHYLLLFIKPLTHEPLKDLLEAIYYKSEGAEKKLYDRNKWRIIIEMEDFILTC